MTPDECPECAAKPGAPILCADCLRRRGEVAAALRAPPTPSPRDAALEEAAAIADDLSRRAMALARHSTTTVGWDRLMGQVGAAGEIAARIRALSKG